LQLVETPASPATSSRRPLTEELDKTSSSSVVNLNSEQTTMPARKPRQPPSAFKRFWKTYGKQITNLLVVAAVAYAVYQANEAKDEVNAAVSKAEELERRLAASVSSSEQSLSSVRQLLNTANSTLSGLSQKLAEDLRTTELTTNISLQQVRSTVTSANASIIALQGDVNTQLDRVQNLTTTLNRNVQNVQPLVSFLNATNSSSVIEGLRKTPVKLQYWDVNINDFAVLESSGGYVCCDIHARAFQEGSYHSMVCRSDDTVFTNCDQVGNGWQWAATSEANDTKIVRLVVTGKVVCVQDQSSTARCKCFSLAEDLTVYVTWGPLMGVRCYRGGN